MLFKTALTKLLAFYLIVIGIVQFTMTNRTVSSFVFHSSDNFVLSGNLLNG